MYVTSTVYLVIAILILYKYIMSCSIYDTRMSYDRCYIYTLLRYALTVYVGTGIITV